MAGISLSYLKKEKFSADDVNSNYIFTDVDLDLHQDEKNVITNDLIQGYRKVQQKDLAVIHDTEAIANSIFFILATGRGQRPLVPTFGCDLRRYIGEGMTEATLNEIREDVLESLRNWEPRIDTVSVTVTPNEEEHEYLLEITARVPMFRNQQISVFGKVTTTENFVRILPQ